MSCHTWRTGDLDLVEVVPIICRPGSACFAAAGCGSVSLVPGSKVKVPFWAIMLHSCEVAGLKAVELKRTWDKV